MRGISSLSDCNRQINLLYAFDNAILVCNLLAQTMGHPAYVITHPDLDLSVDGLFITVAGF